jgi:DNA-binding MarR family transcriptional regulator
MPVVSEQPGTRSPADEAWALLVAMVFSQREHVMDAAAAEDLTPGHAIALVNLDPDRPRPMRELASIIRCDASYLTGVIDRLEELGLVERRPSPEDRRVKALVVTDRGRIAHARLKAAWLNPPQAMLALSDTDQRTLRRIARKLVGGTDTSGVLPFLRPR